MGWGHLQEVHADPIQQFYSAHLNPYLNYHRPCAQADIEVDAKGRIRRRYRRYAARTNDANDAEGCLDKLFGQTLKRMFRTMPYQAEQDCSVPF